MTTSYSSALASLASASALSRVEVNQRALIDKILARYATEFSVFRELLQNSNDAAATQAEIIFETNEEGLVRQVIYRNNGKPFTDADWARLKKIAEGACTVVPKL